MAPAIPLSAARVDGRLRTPGVPNPHTVVAATPCSGLPAIAALLAVVALHRLGHSYLRTPRTVVLYGYEWALIAELACAGLTGLGARLPLAWHARHFPPIASVTQCA